MSEGDQHGGLKKLADYLAQTRRQAEASIDALNERIAELTRELEVAQEAAEQLQSERDFFRNYAEQLKLENSKKWRLQERDDWKSLVDSVQTDRSRLQDECHRLEVALEESQRELEALKHASVADRRGNAPASPTPAASSSRSFFFGSPVVTTSANGSTTAVSPDSADALAADQPESPRAMTKQLKLELAKAHTKLQVVRAAAEATSLSQESEITRLRQELERAKKSKHASGSNWSRGGGAVSLRRGAGGHGLPYDYDEGSGGWYNPLGLLTFFFSTDDQGSKKELTGVLHV